MLSAHVGRFRARVAEERIVQVARRHGGQARGEFEHLGVAELEGRREVELGGRFLNRRHDRLAAMPGVGAPSPPNHRGSAARTCRDVMSLARAIIRGRFLKARLGVKPIQNGSRLLGEGSHAATPSRFIGLFIVSSPGGNNW